MPNQNERRARVFISCGQSKRSDEVTTAKQIESRLKELGFDPYVAVEEQSLRGLKENLFSQLEGSEYFVFVDFKRELLDGSDEIHRGSLFSHQELAIASFLDIPVIAFQERGTKSDDGILGFLQANATPFTDRELLSSVIADRVQSRAWDPHLRNELMLDRKANQFGDSLLRGTSKTGRFFHVSVKNMHSRKTANNCYVYLEKAVRLNPKVEIPLKSFEFKWEGYTLPNAHISPKTERGFDAFFILHDLTTTLQFNGFTDSTALLPQIHGEGEYELSYSVVCDNFPTARIDLHLNLSGTLDETTLAPAGPTSGNP